MTLHMRVISSCMIVAFTAGTLLVLSSGPALAQREARPPPETRKSQVMRKKAFEKISPVQELLAEGKTQEAFAALQAINLEPFNDFEKAVTYQMYGYAYSGQEKYKEAIDFFQKAIATNALAPNVQLDLKFNTAQLYRAVDNVDKSLGLFEEWLAEAPDPTGTQYFQISSTYYQAERYKESLPLAQKAIASTDSPAENWLNLIVALYLEDSLKDYRKALPFLEQLATRFPKASYWKQLAAVYSELQQEKNSFVTLELAYNQGFLTENNDLRRLAEMYLYHEIPYKSAVLIEKEIEAGRMKKEERNWELLANAWFQARETDKAIPPLERAAALAKNGEHYMTVAQLHIDGERWKDAIGALGKALEKGDLESPGKAHLLRGIALFNQGQSGAARKAFVRAQKFDDTRKQGQQWVKHLERQAAMDAAE